MSSNKQSINGKSPSQSKKQKWIYFLGFAALLVSGAMLFIQSLDTNISRNLALVPGLLGSGILALLFGKHRTSIGFMLILLSILVSELEGWQRSFSWIMILGFILILWEITRDSRFLSGKKKVVDGLFVIISLIVLALFMSVIISHLLSFGTVSGTPIREGWALLFGVSVAHAAPAATAPASTLPGRVTSPTPQKVQDVLPSALVRQLTSTGVLDPNGQTNGLLMDIDMK